MYQGNFDENGNLKKETIMHGYRTSNGGDLTENDNVEMWKLLIHDCKHLHGGDLNENEKYKKI